jgi:GDP-L-fucose synthase
LKENAKIYIAGHRGMVGSAILKTLELQGFHNFVIRTSSELDLRNQQAVFDFFEREKPEYVFLAAAKVGGIVANNTYRAEFIYDNICLQSNVIHAAYMNNVEKLMFLGSSCIYPKMAPQPMSEDSLLTGMLEPTNEPYAVAKIAGIKMCEAYRDQYNCNFISVMPTNLYGSNDNYDLQNSHVLPAMIRKFHEAKLEGKEKVEIWGTGAPKREFLHADDMADACVFLMKTYDGKGFLNIGTGEDISIKDLALLVKKVVGFSGALHFDISKPDGTLRKLMNVDHLHNLGWKHTIELETGIAMAYEDFLANRVRKM